MFDALRAGFDWLVPRGFPELQERTTLEDLLQRVAPFRASPWRTASTVEAMGVPAVFRAVTLVANTTGVLSLEAFRQEARLSADDTPQIVKRPDPFTTPQVFMRDTVDYLARLGEAWWWVAKRDGDGVAQSLIPVDPREVTVEHSRDSRLRPVIRWFDTPMRNEDMRQITYFRDPRNPLRGWGPLQACQAAVSITVEAQEWAANYYAGNPTNTVIKAAYGVDATEAAAIKEAWMAGAGNLPKVIDPGIDTVNNIGTNPEDAQWTQVRMFQNGEVALAFGIPGTLLEHFSPGASLTYQNVGQEFDKFIRSCLWPNYLEPIEQALSDLLTRQTICRFNVDALLRPDPQTRASIYQTLIPLEVMTAEEARQAEGLEAGGIENRAVPFAPPAAVPVSLPVAFRELELRDVRHDCGNLVGRVAGRAELWCRHCKRAVMVDSENPAGLLSALA